MLNPSAGSKSVKYKISCILSEVSVTLLQTIPANRIKLCLDSAFVPVIISKCLLKKIRNDLGNILTFLFGLLTEILPGGLRYTYRNIHNSTHTKSNIFRTPGCSK
jgi:hypothetical protein